MNEKKFEFMIHLTGDSLTPELTRSLEELVAPEGYVVEVQPVPEVDKYVAYEASMRASDAKYKIYLDERAVIVKKDFLFDLLKIFESDDKIGAVGTSGAIELPSNGISYYADKRTDKDYAGEVAIIDGYFFATQYDLPWRYEDFQDDFFGGQAQCVEFKRAGYKLFVAAQDEPWISHEEVMFISNESSRKLFLDEYSKDLFPLVTVIIPTADNSRYFKEALDSALNQTYRNIEVIVSDDSTDDATEQLIKGYDDARIKYLRNAADFVRDYDNPDAEYVNWLADGDQFYPTKLEQMVEVYRNNPDVSLVTSKRSIIDEYGDIVEEVNAPFSISSKVDGDEAGRILFSDFENYVGDSTTVLIRKKFLGDNENGAADISTWCRLLTQGKLYFICEALSACRAKEENAPLEAIRWAKLVKRAWEQKIFLATETDLRTAILAWFEFSALRGLKLPLQRDYHGAEVEALEKVFAAMALALSNGYQIELPPVDSI